MPRIRCHYTDCIFVDEGYCSAAAVELDPDTGCATYSPGDGTATVRFFFRIRDTYAEDPATGSACANLGGWCIAFGRAPVRLTLLQGDQIARPSTLNLTVDERQTIRVSGAVAYLGRGEISI